MTERPPAEVELDDLLQQYLREAKVELAEEAAETERLRAAFEAGAPLVLLQPTELFDPLDQRTIRVPGATVVTVAEHEGDILIGQLADNSHSIGVVYEEPERWYPRKYFLPLAILVDRLRVRTDDPEARATHAGLPVKGLAHQGVDAGTAVAVRRIEDLALRDEYATLPRGTLITLRRGAAARDPETGAEVTLAPGTQAEVTAAVGDFGDPDEPVLQDIPIAVAGRALVIGFEDLLGLDFSADVLSPRAREKKESEAVARRMALRRLAGVGLGLAFLTAGGMWYARARDEAEARRQVLAALIPEIALLHGYFSAGGKYWFELQGLVMDLKAAGSLEPARRLRELLTPVAALSRALDQVYRETFHRTVHSGWREQKHYRTDKDGKRTYTHSTWHKTYSTVWCEPRGLSGTHTTVAGWSSGDAHRLARAGRLCDERIFNLLASDEEKAEGDFALAKRHVGFGRDAAISALSATLMAMPPAFYDDLFRWFGPGPGAHVAPSKGLVTHQKDALLLAGVVSGVVLAHRHRRKLDAQLRQNKYDLGQQLESQIRRVPTLSLEAAWTEFFGQPRPDDLPGTLRARRAECRRIAAGAVDFTYVYGSGWDHGRPLDPLFISAAPVRNRFDSDADRWLPLADTLAGFLGVRSHRDALLPLLRNAVGTEILDRQIREDQSEAQGGSLRNAAWFALPLWGAAVLDGIAKAVR